MGRRRGGGGGFGGGRPRAPPPRPASSHGNAPPPAAQQRQSGGSMMGGLGSMVMQGMAWGTGSSIARHAVGGVLGSGGGGAPAEEAARPTQDAAPARNPCATQMKAFSACLEQNVDDINKCQVYVDMLQACKRGDLA